MANTLFDGQRLTMDEAIAMTAASLASYGRRYKHWCIAWSGGKDSTATLTLVLWLIESGQVPRPKTLRVLYADTRQEILPLWHCAADLRRQLSTKGVECQIVMAPIDKRMWVYILGRGVPPPNNNTLRYCTRQIKIEPMAVEVQKQANGRGRKVLVLTGVRVGESAVRDHRIALSCSTNGAECGQGWFQESLPGDACDTLAPLLHWRVCHVWDWLRFFAPAQEYGGWSTRLLADAYGGDEAQEINARTGCVCCPLASRDTALDAVLRMEHWAYLKPLKKIRGLYEEMRLPRHRLRKPGGERRKDGTLCTNQQRMGPLTIESRWHFLERLIDIHREVNFEAAKLGRPEIDHLNYEEITRIKELLCDEIWPEGWTGTEPRADALLPSVHADGSVQELLFDNDFEASVECR